MSLANIDLERDSTTTRAISRRSDWIEIFDAPLEARSRADVIIKRHRPRDVRTIDLQHREHRYPAIDPRHQTIQPSMTSAFGMIPPYRSRPRDPRRRPR